MEIAQILASSAKNHFKNQIPIQPLFNHTDYICVTFYYNRAYSHLSSSLCLILLWFWTMPCSKSFAILVEYFAHKIPMDENSFSSFTYVIQNVSINIIMIEKQKKVLMSYVTYHNIKVDAMKSALKNTFIHYTLQMCHELRLMVDYNSSITFSLSLSLCTRNKTDVRMQFATEKQKKKQKCLAFWKEWVKLKK